MTTWCSRWLFPVAADAAPGSTPAVRVHAGRQSWTLARAAGTHGVVPLAGAARGFIGRSFRLTNGVTKTYHLVVLTAPSAALGENALGVWAEIIGQGDDRLRVGNPVVAELLAQDPALARIFHRAHPMHDQALFAAALEMRIAARGSNNSALDPKAHGKRLATMLLPDVLPFHPGAPVGYTFAGQNGRHPADPVRDIVNTILAGVVTPQASTDGPFRTTKAFPYFETTAT